MKTLRVYLILIVCFKNTQAQNTYLNYKYAIKAYNSTSYEQLHEPVLTDSLMPTIRSENTTFQYIHPTLAFQWKTKKENFREIELVNFYFNSKEQKQELVDSLGNVIKDLNTEVLRSFGVSLRYEYIVIFKKLKASKFVPSISYSGNLYFKNDQLIPAFSNNFRSDQSFLGARGFVIPRINYFISQRVFFDLNLPICVMDLYYRVDQKEDPRIPANQQRISNINFELFPKVFSIRIGVGFII